MGIPRLTPWLRSTFPDAFRSEAWTYYDLLFHILNDPSG